MTEFCLRPANLLKKEALAQVFSCESREIFKNISIEHLWWLPLNLRGSFFCIWQLRTRITFSIAPAKISLSLFIFTHTKYIYLKKRINFLSNHGTHKIKLKGLKKKIMKHFYGNWSLKSEKVIMLWKSYDRILIFCSLKMCLQFF